MFRKLVYLTINFQSEPSNFSLGALGLKEVPKLKWGLSKIKGKYNKN